MEKQEPQSGNHRVFGGFICKVIEIYEGKAHLR